MTDGDLVDDGSFTPARDDVTTRDPLGFPGYGDTHRRAAERSGADESVVCGPATIAGIPVEYAAFTFSFMGGTMGEVAGERLVRAMGRAAERRVPFVLKTATGGARMQEGMRSLLQMPRLVAARLRLARDRVPYVGILGDPTTGGVLASIGGLADVTIAESPATIGFAGPRLVEAFTGAPLRAGSHTAASALAHGLVDHVADAAELRAVVGEVLQVLAADDPVAPPDRPAGGIDPLGDGWEALQAVRAPDRPRPLDLARDAADAWFELRGDRSGTDDRALWCGLARIAGRRALVLALDPAHAPAPGAYRKARRGMAVAGRLGLPVVTLIDVRGADPSEGSEAGGIAWEIAATFDAMLSLEVPTLAIVTGEGGSGGALALAAADTVLAYPDSVFSVIAPESAAEILWRDPHRAEEAARSLRIAAADLTSLNVVDGVIDARLDSGSLRAAVAYHLARLASGPTGRDRITSRLERWHDK